MILRQEEYLLNYGSVGLVEPQELRIGTRSLRMRQDGLCRKDLDAARPKNLGPHNPPNNRERESELIGYADNIVVSRIITQPGFQPGFLRDNHMSLGALPAPEDETRGALWADAASQVAAGNRIGGVKSISSGALKTNLPLLMGAGPPSSNNPTFPSLAASLPVWSERLLLPALRSLCMSAAQGGRICR